MLRALERHIRALRHLARRAKAMGLGVVNDLATVSRPPNLEPSFLDRNAARLRRYGEAHLRFSRGTMPRYHDAQSWQREKQALRQSAWFYARASDAIDRLSAAIRKDGGKA